LKFLQVAKRKFEWIENFASYAKPPLLQVDFGHQQIVSDKEVLTRRDPGIEQIHGHLISQVGAGITD